MQNFAQYPCMLNYVLQHILAIDKANKLDNMNLEFVRIDLDTEYFNTAVNSFRLAHNYLLLINKV